MYPNSMVLAVSTTQLQIS